MKRHHTDLFALLFGLAFTIAGVAVMVSQASSADISPRWITATGLIVLGAVALAATLLRSQEASAHEHAFSRLDVLPVDVVPVDAGPAGAGPVDVAPAADDEPVSPVEPAD